MCSPASPKNYVMNTRQVVQLLAEAKQQGIFVFLEDQRLRYKTREGIKPSKEMLEVLSVNKEEILQFLLQAQAMNETNLAPIPSQSLQAISTLPVSFAQERMWFVDQLEGSLHYHIPSIWQVEGILDIPKLEKAFQGLIDRHLVLRTRFQGHSDGVRQELLSAADWRLEVSQVNPKEGFDLAAYVKQRVESSFDLTIDFPVRAQLIQLGEQQYKLVLIVHHIAADGWSMAILFNDLTELYLAQVEGHQANLAKLGIQYYDYAHWQRTYLSGDKLEKELLFWEENLKEVPALDLPTDWPRPAVQSTKGATASIALGVDLSKTLQQLSIQEDVTLYMLLLSVIKVWLKYYTGQNDICIGSPVAGRSKSELENLIGCFVNTLPLRTQLSDQQPFQDLLAEVKENVLQAFSHQEVPFEKIVERVTTKRDRSRNALSEVIFVLQNTPDIPTRTIGNLAFTAEPFSQETASYDLHISAIQGQDEISISINYCKDLFGEDTIQRMLNHLETLLGLVATQPSTCIGDFDLLSVVEKQQILFDFNMTCTDIGETETLVQLFDQQVAITPDAIALHYEGMSFTYREIAAKADKLAYLLAHSYEIELGDRVGVLMDRSAWAIISILGVMKAGGVYVPIDLGFPLSRKKFIIDDAALQCLIIHSQDLMEMIGFQVPVVSVDLQLEGWEMDQPIAIELQREDLAYIIYTSGSTGEPKGVMIPHRGIVNTVLAQIPMFGIQKGDHCLQFASLVFDASLSEIFTSLIGGGELYIVQEAAKKDLNLMMEYLQGHAIDVATLPPALLSQIPPPALSSLKMLVSAGESAPFEQVNQFLAYGDYCNAYGPTETSICATMNAYKKGSQIERTNVPIGQPIANTQVYIVNSAGQLAPIGVVGELYVGGNGLATGYLNKPIATENSFNNPIASETDSIRLYRTGDLARWLPDGRIQFIGRKDNQVKIRGYRIELNEVANLIQQAEHVGQAICVLHSLGDHDSQIIAYFSSTKDKVEEELWKYIKEHVPSYMVPAALIRVSEFTLNASGKIDRSKLPDPTGNTPLQREYVAPKNDTEKQLALIWESLLQIERIGTKDNFFEIGGHSLLLTRLASAIQEAFQLTIPITLLFDMGDMASMAKYIQLAQRSLAKEKSAAVEYEI